MPKTKTEDSPWTPTVLVKAKNLSTQIITKGKQMIDLRELHDLNHESFEGLVVDVNAKNSFLKSVFQYNMEAELFRISDNTNFHSIFLSTEINLKNFKENTELLLMYSSQLSNPSQLVFLENTCLTYELELAEAVKRIIRNSNKISSILMNVKDAHLDWNKWSKFYQMLNFDAKVKLNIDLCTLIDLDPGKLNRFLAENIGAITINAEDLRCLNNSIVEFIIKTNSLCLFEFENINPDCNNYVETFLDAIKQNDFNITFKSTISDLSSTPMQPLGINLTNGNYASFEQDPVKYKLYQEAIRQALIDRKSTANSNSTMNVMILGAGRGPLCRAAFEAAKAAQCDIEIIVVEKNSTIFYMLKQTIAELKRQGAKIHLFEGYMQKVKIPAHLKADIFVSELLGAFGCNELSPECLDGAEKNGLLKADGISIPQSYESHIEPIMSWRLINGFHKSCSFQDKFWSSNCVNYVSIDQLQMLWKFEHPMRCRAAESMNNARCVKLTFTAQDDAVLHGFAAYFSTTLYKDIEFNIVRGRHTKDLISWWPNYFPAKSFKVLKQGEQFSVEFERKIDDIKVWYEWTVEGCATSNVQGLCHPLARSMEVVKCIRSSK